MICAVLVLYKFNVMDRHQSEFEKKYDSAIAQMENDIASLKQQNTQEQDIIDRMRIYISALQSNLTQLRSEHEVSIQELQERSETDSHLLSLIDFHSRRSQLINETLSHVEELSNMQNSDISYQLSVLRERNRNLTSALQENGKSDTELHNSFQQQQQRVQGSVNNIQDGLDTLNSKTRTSVHPFEHCKSEHHTCTIGSRGNGRYWKACPTQFFPISKEVCI